jgi:hypothetical protein
MIKTIGIIVLIGALGTGAYFVFKPEASVAPEIEIKSEVSDTGTEAAAGKKMAFAEFIKQGGSYVCTVNQEVNNTTANGTVYISGTNLRGEFKTSYNGTNMNISTIVRDEYAYTWTSMMPSMGFKSKVVAPTGANTSAGTSGSYSWNAEAIGDYSCDPWTIDASKFVLPSGVTFSEVGK